VDDIGLGRKGVSCFFSSLDKLVLFLFLFGRSFVFGIQRCFYKLSLGALLVMKISLIKGQFFLIAPLCFGIQRCLVKVHLVNSWS
jgi:hypothetical protein